MLKIAIVVCALMLIGAAYLHHTEREVVATLVAVFAIAIVPATFFRDMPPEGVGYRPPDEIGYLAPLRSTPPDLIFGMYRDGTVLIYTDRGNEIRGGVADFTVTSSLPAAGDFLRDGGQLQREQFFIVRFNSNSEIQDYGKTGSDSSRSNRGHL